MIPSRECRAALTRIDNICRYGVGGARSSSARRVRSVRGAVAPTSAPLTIFSYRSFEHTLDTVVVKRMAAFLNAGVRLGALRPAIDKVFALDDVVEAHRHLEKGLHAGKKIVVTV